MMRERVLSLDIFRGMTVVFMILVNNPGSWSHIHMAFRHAAWHGLLPADLVFPFFLFIMGVSIELSLGSRIGLSDDRGRIISHIIRRTVILFMLGLFLNGFPFYPSERVLHIRIPGVLQRIAIVYCITSFVCLRGGAVRQWTILVFLLCGYWGMCSLVPVPGIGYPNMEMATNLAAWLDRLLMHGHLWPVTATWDPEGLLSTLSAVTTSLLGASAGRIVKGDSENSAKLVRLVSSGVVLSAAGILWHPFFPINKNLWTGSYSLFTAGVASLSLALLYYTIDVKRSVWWIGPFLVMGVNSLAAFFLSSLLARIMNVVTVADAAGPVSLQVYLYTNYFASHLSALNASLAWALSQAVLWVIVMAVLYGRKVFIKL